MTLEVPARDAEAAGALLSAVTGDGIAIERREGARAASASAYVLDTKAAPLLRALRTRIRQWRRDGTLRDAVLRHAVVKEEDWSQTWRQHFRPFLAARGLYIVPPWEKRFSPPPGSRTLIIDPGMAFGTGRHATTRLALRLIARAIEPHDIVVDVGCGSGVLAIAAAFQGAAVYAVDEDPIAVAATRSNLRRNKIRGVSVARADRIPAAFPKADAIAANLSGEVLQPLAAHLAGHLKRGGCLVTSGITAHNRLATLSSFARAGLEFIEERRSGEWFAYVHRKPASAVMQSRPLEAGF